MKKLLSLLFTIPFLFCSCILVIDPDNISYEKNDKYVSGEKIFSIDNYSINSFTINWINGSITINYHDENSIILHEEANRSLSDATEVHWYYDENNHQLNIQYCKSKAKIPSKLQKDLILTLPSILQTQRIDINNVNAKVNVQNISVEDFECDDINGGGNLSFSNTLKFINIDSVNGDFKITAPGFEEGTFDSTNSDFSLTTTVSAPNKISHDAGNGNFKLCIPENDGFSVKFNTVTGKFTCTDFQTSVSNNTYLYNSNAGNRKYKFDSVNGNLEITKYIGSN